MPKVIVECPHCAQRNRVDSEQIHGGKCGKCKKPLVEDTVVSKRQGRIKFYNDEKGFGFIHDENYEEYFFHISNVKSNIPILKKNSLVEFEIAESQKGLEAVNIILIDKGLNTFNTFSTPKFININNKRILLTKIKKYNVYSHTLYYRNNHQIPKAPKGLNLFKRFQFDLKMEMEYAKNDYRDLYDTKTFDYLYIFMFDGTELYFYSDTLVKDMYYRSKSYLKKDVPDSIHVNDVEKSVKFMENRNFEFSAESISDIVEKLDTVYNSI